MTNLDRRWGLPASAVAEELLAGLFAEVLDVPRVDPRDNFFRLGGHSLLATRLISRIRATLNVELSVRDLFEAPTVAELARRLGSASRVREPVRAVPRPARLPLSYAQRRLWFLNQLEGASPTYNIPIALRLRGPLDHGALRAALGDVVDRHEALRTVYPTVGGLPTQEIRPAATARPDLLVRDTAETELAGLLAAAGAEGFDLSGDLPLRASLYRLGPADHVLLLVLHHIAGDGWSLGPLRADLSAAYAARSRGADPGLAPLPVQYADYTLWQQRLLGSEDDPNSPIARQLDYWRRALHGLPGRLDLPTDRPRPAIASYRGGDLDFRLDAELHRGLLEIARRSRVSLFMVLQAAVAVLLTRLGAGTDLPIGSPVAGRTDDALDELIGFFVNTLVLRVDTSGDPTFRELLERVRSVDLAAYENQDVPFERLVEALNPVRSLAMHPLFQVILTFQSNVEPRLDAADVRSELHPVQTQVAKFDLALFFEDHRAAGGEPAGVSGAVEYAADLFDPGTVERIVHRLVMVLRAVAADPDLRVSQVNVLTADERRAVEAEWGRDQPAGPATTVPAVLEAQAARSPGAVAVADGTVAVSYAELHARADKLARVLARTGAGPEQVVAVLVPRSAAMVVAVLAVVKAGAAYLPVDPDYPEARLRFMLADARPVAVLTTGELAGAIPAGAAAIVLDADGGSALIHPEEPAGALTDAERTAPLRPLHPAYVIYTSGSTGRPKGVVMSGQGVVNLLEWHATLLPGGPGTRTAQFTALGFDFSVQEILGTLAAGKTLVLAPADARRDPVRLAHWLAEQQVDELCAPNLVVEALAEAAAAENVSLPRLRHVVQGGEELRLSRPVRAFFGTGRRLSNEYGPAETHAATVATLPADPAGWPAVAPIGELLPNVRAYVLDDGLSPVPPGVPGQLHIGGRQLGRGYLHRSGLTAERFVPDPYGAPGSRMYRSGDLVRRRAGALEFLGRADDQVKIRGFRVEPGEIEAVLGAHPDVGQAVVLARSDRPGDRTLVAYVVPGPGRAVDIDRLRRHAAGRLPDYMVPAAFVVLAALPLGPNGKLARSELPAPPAAGAGREPATAQERAMCALFAEVLGLDGAGPDDNFFDLGGHSLLATRLVSRIRTVLGAEVGIRDLFETPTPTGLAAAAAAAAPARPALRPVPRPDRVPLSYAQQRLWFLERLNDLRTAYTVPIAFRLRGPLDAEALEAALGDLVGRHESLRTVFPDEDGTPYQLVLEPELARPSLTRREADPQELDGVLLAALDRGYDLATEPPLRCTLVRVGPADHVLLLALHHIAGDGWSMRPLTRDLGVAYSARLAGTAPDWSPLPVQYADYTLWQRELLGVHDDPDSLAARQLRFWTGELAGLPDELELPEAGRRPAVSDFAGAEVETELDAALHRRLVELATGRRASLYMVVQAALAALLSRLGAGEDVPLGCPVAGRTDDALEDLVGFFVNTVVLRTDTSGDPTFAALLDRVRDRDLSAYAHQDVPFERLVDVLEPARSMARHPLFQVMLGLENNADAPLRLPGLSVAEHLVHPGSAKFDLAFGLVEDRAEDGAPAGITMAVEYRTDRFDRDAVVRLTGRLVSFLEQVAADPTIRIGDVEVLTAVEREALESDRSGPRLAVDAGTTLPDVLARQAARTPDAPALTAGDEVLSFRELSARTGRLARQLIALGAGPERRVVLLLERSADLVVALLATLESGAAYVPVDPGQPAARVAQLVADAGATVLVTAGSVPVPAGPAVVLRLDEPDTAAAIAARPPGPVRPSERLGPLRPAHPAYVIYTSGSSGRPKGVVVEHHNVVNVFHDHHQRLVSPAVRAFGRPLRVAHTYSFAFDASIDPLLWMLGGNELVLVPGDRFADPAEFVRLVRRDRIDCIDLTPSYLEELLAAGLFAGEHRPAVVVVGGEAVSGPLWSALRGLDGVTAHNVYGPTETTLDCCAAALADSATPSIGRPAANVRIDVLDPDLRPVPPGVTAAAHVAGAQVARGYLDRPADTADRFRPDPLGPPGARRYRTGDLVRRRPDGQLEFVGRADDQVKIRGFRVELGEVEAALGAHPDVAACAAAVREDTPGNRRLVAYVLPAADRTPTGPALRSHVAGLLPDHLTPSAYVLVDQLPRGTAGKVDRRRLPAPPPERGRYALGTPREEAVSALFAEALGVDRIGPEEDFFAAGGHSLLAARLIIRLRASLGVEVGLGTLFQVPTARGLAERLEAGSGTAERADPLGVLLPLRATGSAAPLFCVHPVSGLGWSYAGLLRHLEPDRPVYALQARGLDGGPRPATLADMAADYAEQIRRVRPTGPWHLLGWSVGGVVAQAVAVRLQRAGTVGLLAVLDGYPDAADAAGAAGPAAALAALLGGIDAELADPAGEGLDEARAVELLRGWADAAGLSGPVTSRLVAGAVHSAALAGRHVPDPYAGSLLLLTAAGRDRDAAVAAWSPYVTGPVRTRPVAADHDDLLRTGAAEVGRLLAAALAETDRARDAR